jgi:hypothetical protein
LYTRLLQIWQNHAQVLFAQRRGQLTSLAGPLDFLALQQTHRQKQTQRRITTSKAIAVSSKYILGIRRHQGVLT